jgi:hypothetical protein
MDQDPRKPPRRDVPSASLPAASPGVKPPDEIASVPRRYGAGTLLVITTAYALLFAAFRAYGADQAWWVGTAVFLTGVGIAQAIAGPKNARPASTIAGVILLPTICIAALMVLGTQHERDFLGEWALGLVCCAALGAPAGYLGGVLVAGIFLLMRYADAAIARRKRGTGEEKAVEADIVDPTEPP